VLVILLLSALLGLSSAQTGDPAARSRAATQAMNDGRFEEAVRIYRELLQPLPDEPGLLMNLGMALAMAGREAEAIAPLERATTLKPTLVPAQLFLGTSYLALGASDKAIRPLRRVSAAEPANLEYRRLLARAYSESGRALEAATVLRQVTDLAPTLPAAWYALFHAYNAVAQDALATFQEGAGSDNWQQLLIADALFSDGRLTDACAAYRQALGALPAMVSIHDAIATIYEQTGHADWAGVERAKGRLTVAQCARRKPLCEFRAGRYRAALAAASGEGAESRYWRARAATQLTKEAFSRLDRLPDSRERRELRAALAIADRRHADAAVELKAAVKYAPKDASLIGQLGIALYLTRDYEQAVALLTPLVNAVPAMEESRMLTAYGDSLLQLDRVDEAVPFLRRAFTADTSDREASLSLARALMRQREFGAALPLLEWQLAGDTDGSVHVQLSRALSELGQQDKADAVLAKSQDIQRAALERAGETGRRAILPPK
jgi:tetratricopeptide (TPR) repeat protein